MVMDQYKKWEPIENLPDVLYCEEVHDDIEGFRVLLRGEEVSSPTLRILFHKVLLFRNIDELHLMATWRRLGEVEAMEESSLFIVENSSLFELFQKESDGIFEGKEIVHYAIYTPNDCLEIISEGKPKVEWMN